MGFLDSITEKDLGLLDQPAFTANERTEFAVLNVKEYVKQTDTGAKVSIGLHTKVLTGPNEGRIHTLFLRDGDKPAAKESYLRAMVGLFGREAITAKTAKLSDLVNKKIAATPGPVRPVGDKDFQNWSRYENLGQLDTTLVNSNNPS